MHRTVAGHAMAGARRGSQEHQTPRKVAHDLSPFADAQIAAMTTVEEAPEAAESESDADSFGKEFEEMLEDSDDEVR